MELERKGEGRATIEPLHREWIQVRNQHIESVEVLAICWYYPPAKHS